MISLILSSCARVAAAITPPAGPDNNALAGFSAILDPGHVPPFDAITFKEVLRPKDERLEDNLFR